MDKKEIIRKIGNVISGFQDVEVAYVFGSFLKSDRFNDIDIALLTYKGFTPYNRFKYAMEIAGRLEKEIKPRFEFDVKILNYSTIEFQHEVIKKGILVFRKDESGRINYESRLLSEYLDLKGMYDFLDKKFLANI